MPSGAPAGASASAPPDAAADGPGTMSLLDRIRAVPGRVDAWLQPLYATLPWRAYARYGLVRGNVLAGGIAYFAFFSIFPALALGFTAFAVVLGSQEDLQVEVVQYINSSLGATIIGYKEGQGLVNIDQLVQPGLLTTTGIVGLVALVFTGLGWIAALRDGVQAVFTVRSQTNFVVVKLADLALLAGAGLAVLISVVVSVGVDLATGQVLDRLDMPQGPVAGWSVNITSQLTLVVLDTAIFTVLFRRLAGMSVPLRDALVGGALAAVGFAGLKLFASQLLQSVSHNRFLAASSILLGLLVWMNLVARLTLVAAALSATLTADRGLLPVLERGGPAGIVLAPAPGSAAASGSAGSAAASDRAASSALPDPGRSTAVDAMAARQADAAASRRAARLLLAAGFVAGVAGARLTHRAASVVSRGRRRQPPPS
jgi:membrane protein